VERIKGNDLMAVLPKFSEATAFGVLNNFLSEFHNKNGYALPSRYEVLVYPPPMHPNPSAARNVSIRVEAIDMPGRALNTSPDANVYGIQPEIVDGITFAGTIGLTIQTSSDLEERVFFQSWQELAWDRSTWNVRYYKDYVGIMEIYILDINNNRRYGVKIFNCFPKEVGPISLSYTQATDIIKTPITMEYNYWETLDITNQPPSLLDKVLDTVITSAERNINANIPKVLSRL
jgi:hypothetical protein